MARRKSKSNVTMPQTPAPAPTAARYPDWMPGVALFLLAVVIYFPSLGGGFLWDDNTSVTESEIVRNPGGWWQAWFSPPPSHPDYFPLTTDVFWLQWRLWGDHPFGYRLVNLLLHGGCAVLLWRLLREMALPAAWAAAAWVAVHPVNVESVAWIAELKNVLCLACALPAVQYFVRWTRTDSPRDYRISLACHGAALAAKASVVALPLVLVAFLFWRGPRPGKREALAIAPFLLLSLVFGLLVMHFQHQRAMGDWEILMPGLLSRIGGAASAWWFYAGKALWPLNLATIYPRWAIDPPQSWQLLLAVATLAALVILWRLPSQPARAAAFGLSAYSLLLAPALGLIKMSFMRHGLVADHFQHLALPALGSTLVCGGAALMAARPLLWRRVALGLFGVSALLFFGLSWQRALLHANQEALWEDALTKNPQSPAPHVNLGSIHAGRGAFPAAENHFREAIRLGPEDARTLTNLGLTFADRGRYEEAAPWFRKAVALSGRAAYPPAHLNLARALVQLNQQEEGIRVLAQAADRFPDNLLINSAAGASLVLAGKPAEALPCLERSERLDPRGAATKFYLAAAFQALGRNREAAEKRAEAIRLDPSLNGAKLPGQ